VLETNIKIKALTTHKKTPCLHSAGKGFLFHFKAKAP